MKRNPKRQGRPKQEFKHPSHIPFTLAEKNIKTLELANEWQGYMIDGRSKGITDDSYAWAIWNTKYYWSRMDKIWKVRELSKPLPGECKDAILENVVTCLRLIKMNKVNWGYQYVEEMKKKLNAIIEGQKEIESELKLKGAPEDNKEESEEEETIVDENTEEEVDGIDEPI
jgi:hypothetical protein